MSGVTAETAAELGTPSDFGEAAYNAALEAHADGRYGAPTVHWDEQDNLARNGWIRIAEAAIMAGPSAPKRLADGNAKLRAERDELRGRLRAVRKLMEGAVASGIVDAQAVLGQLAEL